MNRFFSGGGRHFSRAVIYSATLSFVGINFFTFSHYIKHSYWDNLHVAPAPSSGQYMQPPEEITNSSKEEKLFYTLKTNHSSDGVKKLLIFLPDIVETREVFQDLEYQILHSQVKDQIYSLRYDRFGYGYSNVVKGPRHLHNMSIELHTLIEHVIKNNIELKENENIEISLVGHGFGTMLARMYMYKFSNTFESEFKNVKITKNVLISPLHERFIQFSPFYLDYLVEWKSRGFINRLLSFHGFMEWLFKFNPRFSLKDEVIYPFMETISDDVPTRNWDITYKGTEGSTNYDDDHLISKDEAKKRLEYHMRNDSLWKTVRNETNLFKRSCVQLNDCRKSAEPHYKQQVTNSMIENATPNGIDNNSTTSTPNSIDSLQTEEQTTQPINTSNIDVLVVDVDHSRDEELGRIGVKHFFDKNSEFSQVDYLNDLVEGYSNKSKVISLNYNHYSVLNTPALAQSVINFLNQ